MGQQIVPYLGLLIYLGVVGFFGWQMLGKGTTGKVGRRAQVRSPLRPRPSGRTRCPAQRPRARAPHSMGAAPRQTARLDSSLTFDDIAGVDEAKAQAAPAAPPPPPLGPIAPQPVAQPTRWERGRCARLWRRARAASPS